MKITIGLIKLYTFLNRFLEKVGLAINNHILFPEVLFQYIDIW